MARNKRNNIYVVETAPGQLKTFDNWPACQDFVRGKPYPFAGGVDKSEAIAKVTAGKEKVAWTKKRGGGAAGFAKPKTPRKTKVKPADYPKVGITADAGTHGNPGPCEYQIADLDGNVLGHKHLGVHTNNFAELAGIGAMIQYAIKHGHTILWTDSKIALAWIKSANPSPTVSERALIRKMALKIQSLLSAHPAIELRKWKTKEWGEIPADFGRK